MTIVIDRVETAEGKTSISAEGPRIGLIMAVALPPPLHGQSTINASMVRFWQARKDVDLTIVNVAPSATGSRLAYHRKRIAGYFLAARHLVSRRREGAKCLYVVFEPGHGRYYTLALCVIARALRYSVVFHHHGSSVIKKRSRVLAFADALLGQRLLHVVLGEAMARDLASAYRLRSAVTVMHNAALIDMTEVAPSPLRRRASDKDRLRLGFLSNLSLEKGLDRFLRCGLDQNGQARKDILLVLAGPAHDPQAQACIDQRRAQLGATLDIRGPVSGQTKTGFFADIDVFCFPSQYRHEAQPLVILEALAHGRPVIAIDTGYVAELLGADDGIAVRADDDYPAAVSSRIIALQSSVAALEAASRKARLRFDDLQAQSLAQLKTLGAVVIAHCASAGAARP